MTIFAFMKKMNIKNKYVFSLVIISIMVAFLIHFPELVSLFDVTGQNALFPDMSVLDVANEVFFTFVSLLLSLVSIGRKRVSLGGRSCSRS